MRFSGTYFAFGRHCRYVDCQVEADVSVVQFLAGYDQGIGWHHSDQMSRNIAHHPNYGSTSKEVSLNEESKEKLLILNLRY